MQEFCKNLAYNFMISFILSNGEIFRMQMKSYFAATMAHFMCLEEQVDEIILATNQTPEGETTAAYIASKLKAKSVKVSCLARGMPVGSSLEYMDRLTVYKAISERRPF